VGDKFVGFYPHPDPLLFYLALWNMQTENLLLLGFCILDWHLFLEYHLQVQSRFVYLHQIQSLGMPESSEDKENLFNKEKQGLLKINICQYF